MKKQNNLFKKGKSGNPAGRPKGIEDKRAKYRKLMQIHGVALINQAVEEALAGDKMMIKLCIDKLMPNARSESIGRGIMKGIKDDDIQSLIETSKSVVVSLSKDDITPTQAKEVMQVIDSHAKLLDRTEIIERLQRIEEKMNG